MSNIDAIKLRYKASFNEKKMMIDGFRQELFETTGELSGLFEKIYSDLHKLAGSLGMYGYEELALQARSGMKQAQIQDKKGLDESLICLSMLFKEQL